MKNHESLASNEKSNTFSNRHFGHMILTLFGENHNKNHLITDSGVASIDNESENNQENDKNATYYNPEKGSFGVYKSIGSLEGAMDAANVAASVTREMFEGEDALTNAEDMSEVMESINDAIYYDPASGQASGAIGRIVEKNGKKFLVYAAVGDSQIFLVRDEEAKPITTTEKPIENSLGRSMAKINQIGEIPLKSNDQIVFCTNGVTDNSNVASIINHATSASRAANTLVKKSTAKEARAAIVVAV
jgi:serine/threonine protein phosphatase PrpC